MQKEDIDEFIDIFLGDGIYDKNRTLNFLNRIGIHATKVPGVAKLEETMKQIAEKIKPNRELVEYLETKDKKTLGEIARWIPEVFDEEYLNKMIAEKDEYEIEDISSLVIQVVISKNDTEYTKKVIEKWQEYNLNGYVISELVESINDPEYTKKIIESWQEYSLRNYNLVKLVKSINDIEYTKEVIEKWKEYGLNSYEVSELVESTKDTDYINEIIKRREEFGFNSYDVTSLVRSVNNLKYTKEVICKWKEFGFDSTNIIKLVVSTNDREYIDEIIKNRKEYGLTDYDIYDLCIEINNIEFTKEIIENNSQYGLKSDALVILIARIEKEDPDYTRDVIENYEQYGLNNSDITELLVRKNDSYYTRKVIENCEKYKLDSNNVAKLVNIIQEEDRVETLKKLDITVAEIYRERYASLQFIKEHLKEFLEIEGNNAEAELILEMAEKNEDILKSKYDIITDKYVNILGKDIVSQLSCYPYIVEKVKKLDNEKLTIFKNALDSYLQETGGEEWTPLANRILDNIGSYGELVSNLGENKCVDINKLIPILIHPNDFGIKTIEDVENFKEIKRKRCEELIKGETVEEKQKGVLLKIFGQSNIETIEMVEKFGEDIDKIGDGDLKAYIKSLQEILSTKNPKALEEIFWQVEELETTNTLLMERMLKTEYWKLYNNDLFKIENAKKLPDGENVYSAGTDFKMIITSVGAYFYNQPDDYKKDWNRSALGSQHFCASYIRNDMLGHAPIPHICYGFEQMKEDSLMLSGAEDIWSSTGELESVAYQGDRYLAPDNQIRNTRGYNEMDFRRVQGGVKKQPDYIVVFRKNGEILNMDKAQKASRDFGGLPIVVIDEDECLKSERAKAKELFEEYKKTGDPQVKAKLQEKLRNNRVTDSEFCRDTDMDAVLESSDDKEKTAQEETKQEVTMEDLDEIYGEVSDKERQEEVGKIRVIYEKIRNIKEREDDSDAR